MRQQLKELGVTAKGQDIFIFESAQFIYYVKDRDNDDVDDMDCTLNVCHVVIV